MGQRAPIHRALLAAIHPRRMGALTTLPGPTTEPRPVRLQRNGRRHAHRPCPNLGPRTRRKETNPRPSNNNRLPDIPQKRVCQNPQNSPRRRKQIRRRRAARERALARSVPPDLSPCSVPATHRPGFRVPKSKHSHHDRREYGGW